MKTKAKFCLPCKLLILTLSIFTLFPFSPSFAQDGTRKVFDPITTHKDDSANIQLDDSTPATIVFIPITKYKVEYFRNDKYIGKSTGGKYYKYLCPPGKQLIWASERNLDFMKCDLKPGGLYIFYVYQPGVTRWDGRVNFKLINDSTMFKSHYKYMKKRLFKAKWIFFADYQIDQMNLELKEWIDEKMMKYETKGQFSTHVEQITQGMATNDPEILIFFNLK